MKLRKDSAQGMPLFATVPDLAWATGMKPSFIYKKIAEEKIIAKRFGKRALRIPRSEFDRVIEHGLPED